jgi:hypothetical protein
LELSILVYNGHQATIPRIGDALVLVPSLYLLPSRRAKEGLHQLGATVCAWPSQKYVVSNGHQATIPRSGPVPGDAGVVPVSSLSSSMVEKDVMAFFDIFVVALFDPSIFATVKDFDVT